MKKFKHMKMSHHRHKGIQNVSRGLADMMASAEGDEAEASADVDTSKVLEHMPELDKIRQVPCPMHPRAQVFIHP
jgi:hypothetical protein